MSTFIAGLLPFNDKNYCVTKLIEVEQQYFIGRHNQYERAAANAGIVLDITRVPKVIYRWDHGDNTNYPHTFRFSFSKKLRHFLPAALSKGRRWVPRKRDDILGLEFGLI